MADLSAELQKMEYEVFGLAREYAEALASEDLQKLAKIQSNTSEIESTIKIENITEISNLINPIKIRELNKTINSTVAKSARNILDEFLHTPSLENYNELEKFLKSLKNFAF